MYVIYSFEGHGVDDELVKSVLQSSQDFFLLPPSAKAMHATAHYGDPKGGYSRLGIEAVERSNGYRDESKAAADLVESFLFPFPPSLYSSSSPLKEEEGEEEGREETILHAQEYYDAMLTLLQALHRISSEALHISLEYFNSHYHSMISSKLKKSITGFYLRFAYVRTTVYSVYILYTVVHELCSV